MFCWRPPRRRRLRARRPYRLAGTSAQPRWLGSAPKYLFTIESVFGRQIFRDDQNRVVRRIEGLKKKPARAQSARFSKSDAVPIRLCRSWTLLRVANILPKDAERRFSPCSRVVSTTENPSPSFLKINRSPSGDSYWRPSRSVVPPKEFL